MAKANKQAKSGDGEVGTNQPTASTPQNPQSDPLSGPPKCTATSKRTGERCGANAVTGKSVCYHHGGANGTGGQPGNQNGRTHGLWAKTLATDDGRAIMAEVIEADPKETARKAASMILSHVVEAYTVPAKLGSAAAEAAAYLDLMVADGKLDAASVEAVKVKLLAPHPAQLAKALGPLKGLLDTANQTEDIPTGTLRDLIAAAEAKLPQTDDDWED